MIHPSFGPVKVVHHVNNLSLIESVVAEPLTGMGPVLLLNVGIIVLMVRTGSSKLNRLDSIGKVAQEVIIDELSAIISIKAKHGEGNTRFNAFKSGHSPLPQTAACSVQPAAMSTASTVYAKSPVGALHSELMYRPLRILA